MKKAFVHLSALTTHSFSDGMIPAGELIRRVASQGGVSVAITDIMSLGAYFDVSAAKSRPFTPILGADILVSSESGEVGWIKLLVKDQMGFCNIQRILRRTKQDQESSNNQEKNSAIDSNCNRAVIEFDVIRKRASGLIALSRGRQGSIGKSLLEGNDEKATWHCNQWIEIFGNDFYLEIQRTGHPHDAAVESGSLKLAKSLGVAVVATHDVRFLEKEHYFTAVLKYGINNSTTLSYIINHDVFMPSQYLKSQDEMVELFSDMPDAIGNTLKIAKQCQFDWMMPESKSPNGDISDLRKRAERSLAEYLGYLASRAKDSGEVDENIPDRNTYRHRMESELNFFEQHGFTGSLLLLSEISRSVKRKGHTMSPGEGWLIMSLVAFLLDVTDIDPVRHGLAFAIENDVLWQNEDGTNSAYGASFRKFTIKVDTYIYKECCAPFLLDRPKHWIAALYRPVYHSVQQMIELIVTALANNVVWREHFVDAIYKDKGIVPFEEYIETEFGKTDAWARELYLALRHLITLPFSMEVVENAFVIGGDRLDSGLPQYVVQGQPIPVVDEAVATTSGMHVFWVEPSFYLSLISRFRIAVEKAYGIQHGLRFPYDIQTYDWKKLRKKYKSNDCLRSVFGTNIQAIRKFRELEAKLKTHVVASASEPLALNSVPDVIEDYLSLLVKAVETTHCRLGKGNPPPQAVDYQKASMLRLLYMDFALRKIFNQFPFVCDRVSTIFFYELDRRFCSRVYSPYLFYV